MAKALLNAGRGALFLAIMIAIAVNFARTPPMQSAYENVSIETSSPEKSAKQSDKQSKTLTADRKCPCPTEIEKADCDNGLCSVGLLVIGVASNAPQPFCMKLQRANADLFGKAAEPPIRPPRLII